MPEPRAQLRREHFAHFSRIPTRWGDVDRLGHVNNAVFFSYDESARIEYFERVTADDARFWIDRGLILAHIECDFLQQLHHPAQLDVGIRVRALGRSSLHTQGGLFAGERLVAVTSAVVVCFDFGQQRAVPVPELVRRRILAFERIAPESA